MNNILKILEYNFGKYNSGSSKLVYIIALIILTLSMSVTFIRIPFLSEFISAINIANIALFLLINLIASLVTFSKQISKEKGKLIFTLPIKSWEFIVAKYIEFIILQGSIVLIAYIMISLSGNFMSEVVKLTTLATAYGTTIAYIIITSYIVIFSSYIKKFWLCILTIIVGGGFIHGFVSNSIKFITKLFPYVYMKIGSFIEIDILYSLLNLVWIIALVIISITHLDKKLDII
ncbi:MAG: hypothetical protein GX889_10565 [Clostridiales bacterium]|nr:hypothetical protein [Clostridiales bacterium]